MSDDDQLKEAGFRPKTSSHRRSSPKYETKKGEHGTLYLYKIEYRDKDDPASPVFTMRKYAYDDRHIIHWSIEELQSEDWKMVRFAKVQVGVSQHRWNWHK